MKNVILFNFDLWSHKPVQGRVHRLGETTIINLLKLSLVKNVVSWKSVFPHRHSGLSVWYVMDGIFLALTLCHCASLTRDQSVIIIPEDSPSLGWKLLFRIERLISPFVQYCLKPFEKQSIFYTRAFCRQIRNCLFWQIISPNNLSSSFLIDYKWRRLTR